MNYSDKVSVIVPVYNVEEYLEKCVLSIVYQTYGNLEIILVDDGSTDKSGELCDTLSKKYNRIKVIHKSNAGLSSARNAGVEISQGEYLLFVDSDDYINNNMVEVMLNAMKLLNVSIVECGYNKVSSDFGYIDFSDKDLVVRKDSTEKFVRDVLRWQNHFPMTWNKLYKASVFKEYRFREGKVNEDEFFINEWIQQVKEVGYINFPLYFYRTRQNSIMNKPYTMDRLGSMEAYVERYKIIKLKFPSLKNNMLYTIGYQFLDKQKLVAKENNDKDFMIRNAMINIITPIKDDILASSLSESQKNLIKLCYENREAFFKELKP